MIVKKVEKQRRFVQDHLELFRCPVCQEPLTKVEGNSVYCRQGHQLDFNKHGYLHFLNGAADTEYGREMFISRRRLLEAGLFKPIIQQVAAVLPARPLKILDVGTGEGTPLKQLADLRSNSGDTMVGFDIAKAGVTLATQLDFPAFFCVADLRQLPFNDHSIDAVIELFSPSDYAEFNRVLVPGGLLVKVVPNADYLLELRHRLYQQNDQHYHYDNSKVVALFKHHYPDSQVHRLRYQFNIPAGLQAALVEMTPLHWGKGAQALTTEELAALATVTVDVSVLVAKIH